MGKRTRFVLEIDLGNAAMQTGEDVGAVLREVAERVEDSTVLRPGTDAGSVRDHNGNVVGTWAVRS